MTNANEDIITRLLDREGGLSDHPDDRGSITNRGITIKTLSRWIGREATAAEVEALGEEEARQIYRQFYVLAPGFHKIADARLREQVIDAGVLHGTGWAARRLQEVAGARVDGIVGPRTLKAVNALSGLPVAFTRRRLHRIARIVQGNPSQLAFLTGWVDRTSSFLET